MPFQAALVPVAAMVGCIGIYTYTLPETYALLFRKAEKNAIKKAWKSHLYWKETSAEVMV